MGISTNSLSADLNVMTANPFSGLNSTVSISPPPDRRVFSKKFLIESSVVVGAIPFNSMVRDSSISSWSVCSAAWTLTLTTREAPSKQCCSLCNTVFRTRSEEIERLAVRFFLLLGSEYRTCTVITSIAHFFLQFRFQQGEILEGSDSVRRCAFKKDC